MTRIDGVGATHDEFSSGCSPTESLVWICLSAFRRCGSRASTLSATSDPIVASTLANPQYMTEVVVTEDVVLTVFLGSASNGGPGFDRLRVHWCFGIGLH